MSPCCSATAARRWCCRRPMRRKACWRNAWAATPTPGRSWTCAESASATPSGHPNGYTRWNFDGQEIFKRAVHRHGPGQPRGHGQAGVTIADIDLVIPHQANLRIIDAVGKRLGVRPGQGVRQHPPVRQHVARRPSRWRWWRPSRRAGSSRAPCCCCRASAAG